MKFLWKKEWQAIKYKVRPPIYDSHHIHKDPDSSPSAPRCYSRRKTVDIIRLIDNTNFIDAELVLGSNRRKTIDIDVR